MTDGFGVEGLRNLVFWTCTCQTGKKEALAGVNMTSEMEVTLLELDSTQLVKSSAPGVASRMEDMAANEREKERVKIKRKIEEFS
ncbi:hypothetical protein L2E82_42267 [Cichorium intybus]|uniref:Uncharacterized protein n=1 Tax=Cichorium intybus TaxID=13427 RepID=A0ACB8ZLZ0_CICIN|nr:hypothetical protein L2E82_42267 [Cichorium intybus]